MTATATKQTPLYAQHGSLGAKMVPFGGFLMPLQYSGQRAEHEAVRTGVGLFDLSHMGEFRLRGAGAQAAVDALLTNQFADAPVGQAVYSPMCHEHGGIVDDLIAYNLGDSVFLVPNASNIAKDKAWILEHLPGGVTLDDESDDTALLAIQGPKTQSLLQPLTRTPLDPMDTYTAVPGEVAEVPVLISRTGYTGEDGFELYVSAADAPKLWERLMDAGQPHGLLPIGLAARDTLRFELGYCLYGNDLNDETTPLEANLQWTVKLDKADFVGKAALQAQKAAGIPRRLVGLTPDSAKAIPRAGYTLHQGDTEVGRVTSGTFSPSLERGLAMGYVQNALAKPGTRVEIDVRGRREGAVVGRPPFYTQGSRKAPKPRA